MKMVKSLILGSAAALVAMSGAQAADLPVKAKAVEYVKVCSLYGAGFWYIPGTDTCIKLGGYLRVDVLANTNSDDTGNYSTQAGAQNRFTNGYTWRSRQDLTLDTRTATEYGVVRTFMDVVFTWTGDQFAGNPNGVSTGSTVYGPIGGGALPAAVGVGGIATASAPNNANAGAVAAGTLGVYYAFIQFAGFTMGKAISTFSAPWTNYPGNNFDGLVGGGGTVTGVNQFTYTAQFGNGVSASISAQDQSAYYQAGVNNISAGGAFGTADYGGNIAPDVVGVVKVEQAWGVFQASAAGHQNHAAYYGGAVGVGGTELAGAPGDRWGYAGQLALSLTNLPTGPGDVFNIQGVYTKGATRYNIQDLSQAGAVTIYRGLGSVGFGIAPDSVFGTGTQQALIETYGGRAGFTHNWSPFWNTSVYGAYAAIRYGGSGQALICGGVVNGLAFAGSFRASFGGGGGIATCNPDYNIAQAGIITRWTPVKNLTFSADVTYTNLDQKMVGFATLPLQAAIGKPAGAYTLKDQDTVLVLLRAQRNF